MDTTAPVFPVIAPVVDITSIPPALSDATGAQGPIRRSRAGQRVSRIVFTLNNWTDEEYAYLTTVFAPTVRWIVIGKETGAQGTKHLQGACILGSQWSFSKLKTLTGFARAHIEPMRGTPKDSLSYCTKEDEDAFQLGELPEQGKRNDLAGVYARVASGESLRKIAGDEEGGLAVIKFHKGLTVLRSLLRPVRTAPPGVVWLSGSTGVGKTRLAFDTCRRLCGLLQLPCDDIWISSGGLRWFDGFDGQCCAIFDDFRAKHVTSFAFLLRLLDRYPVQCEIKGAFVEWTPRYIFITCPHGIDDCFSARIQYVPEDIRQLRRRVTMELQLEPIDPRDPGADRLRTALSTEIIGELTAREALSLPGGPAGEGASLSL